MSADILKHQDSCVAETNIPILHRAVNMVVDTKDPFECDGGIKLAALEDTADQITSKTCSFWTKFPGFLPDPTAPFLKDFKCLANLERWSKKDKHGYLVEALNSEIDFYGDKSTGLVRWHRLCQEVGIGGAPTSVTGCKRVSPGTSPRHRIIADAVCDVAIALEALTDSRSSILAS
ncbi:hypothetical protein AALT_g11071 [Alternaria alternata]|nr:hypothetical protein AALT_g11071 [Alternaria alternata]